MGRIATVGKEKGVTRVVRFDGSWWTLNVRNDGFTLRPYKSKSPKKVISRFWREVIVPTDLPLFEKEKENGNSQPPDHPCQLDAPGQPVQRKRRGPA